ncbi:MAG TPA: class I SAM-dependent methyltransferase [Candidatus Dormibacteraeota bacterium]|nr:class I SAM-dependent methyltransferase [Candidatus Dormibacteraeota bacterium]
MEQRDALRAFFSAARWRSSMDLFPLSGWNLIDEVNALRPRFVVDAGCGFNPFKGRIPNLIGIDLVNEAADLVCDLAEAPVRDGSIDVALALGSINFGDREDVRAGLATVHRWLTPGGRLFLRANPGEPIGGGVVVFPWSAEEARSLGAAVGLQVERPVREERIVLSDGRPARRLFWVYRKG